MNRDVKESICFMLVNMMQNLIVCRFACNTLSFLSSCIEFTFPISTFGAT